MGCDASLGSIRPQIIGSLRAGGQIYCVLNSKNVPHLKREEQAHPAHNGEGLEASFSSI